MPNLVVIVDKFVFYKRWTRSKWVSMSSLSVKGTGIALGWPVCDLVNKSVCMDCAHSSFGFSGGGIK